MNRRKVYALLGAAVFLGITAFLFSRFLIYHEAKTDAAGIVFNDVVLNLFPIADCSVYIFGITYGSILLYILLEYKTDQFATRLMLGYAVLLWLRGLTMTLLPLREIESMVFLDDPFLNNMIYPGEIGSDLFFSGHAGLLFLIFFLSRKWVFIILGVILSVLLMVQRVHYSIDIAAAFPIAYFISLLVNRVIPRKKAGLG